MMHITGIRRITFDRIERGLLVAFDCGIGDLVSVEPFDEDVGS